MNKIWKGAFSPVIRKHRDYCGDINNHIRIIDIALTAAGIYLVTVGFVESDEVIEQREFIEGDSVFDEYEFECEFEAQPDEQAIKDEIVRQLRNK